MIKLKILVVLYKKMPSESETLNSFLHFKDKLSKYSELIIYDNSNIFLNSKELQHTTSEFNPLKFNYIANGSNTSLSKIYNEVIRKLEFDEFLIIFDHDTTVELSYFEKLIDAINANKEINLFLPIVNYNNYIVSPSNLWHFKGSYWKTEKFGKIATKGLGAINSGMAINGKYLKSEFEGYDEDLKFYETDLDFITKYAKKNKYLFVIDTKINHILNFYDKSTLDDKLFRFRSSKEGRLIRLKKGSSLIYYFAKLYYFVYSIKCALKFRSFRFLINN